MAQGDTFSFLDRRSVTANVTNDIRPATGVSIQIASIKVAGTDANTNNSRVQVESYEFGTSQGSDVGQNRGEWIEVGLSNSAESQLNDANIFIDNAIGLRQRFIYTANYTGSATITGVQIK